MRRVVELIEELKSLRLKNAPGKHNQRTHAPHTERDAETSYQRPSMQYLAHGHVYVTYAKIDPNTPAGKDFPNEVEASKFFVEQNREWYNYEDKKAAKSDAQKIVSDIGVLRDNIHTNSDMEFKIGAEAPTKKCIRESGHCYNNALDYVRKSSDADLAVGMFVGGPDFDGGIRNVNTHAWVIEGDKHIDPTLGTHEMGLFYYRVPHSKAVKIQNDSLLEMAIEELLTDLKYESKDVGLTKELIRPQ